MKLVVFPPEERKLVLIPAKMNIKFEEFDEDESRIESVDVSLFN